jgi:hypothetical protein
MSKSITLNPILKLLSYIIQSRSDFKLIKIAFDIEQRFKLIAKFAGYYRLSVSILLN